MPDQLSATPQKDSISKIIANYLGEVIRVVLLSLAIILPVRYFLIQPFYVKGASMEPNFYDHEYLVIDEISYRFNDPDRGDIVVFKPPGQGRQHFIKRIVGLPGETIEVTRGEIKVFNSNNPEGSVLNESEYLTGVYTPGNNHVSLKQNEYFLLGDNRSSSLDSRSFGPVDESNITGRVWLRGWPLEKAGSIETPGYNLDQTGSE